MQVRSNWDSVPILRNLVPGDSFASRDSLGRAVAGHEAIVDIDGRGVGDLPGLIGTGGCTSRGDGGGRTRPSGCSLMVSRSRVRRTGPVLERDHRRGERALAVGWHAA